MLYVYYHHRHEPTRELVLPDGGAFPRHLKPQDWYVHATHKAVNGRTEADIATLGFCDRNAGSTFGRKVVAGHHPDLVRRAN